MFFFEKNNKFFVRVKIFYGGKIFQQKKICFFFKKQFCQGKNCWEKCFIKENFCWKKCCQKKIIKNPTQIQDKVQNSRQSTKIKIPRQIQDKVQNPRQI